jgi:hypothetical protein
MNLRCLYCQTPFTLSRAELLTAIVSMNEKHQNHYDAHCPRCRRANSISRQRMELFFPNWREAAKQQAAAAEAAAKAPAPASASLKTEPLKKAVKASTSAVKKAPAAEKKPAAAKKTTTAKKPAEKAPAKTTKSTAKPRKK